MLTDMELLILVPVAMCGIAIVASSLVAPPVDRPEDDHDEWPVCPRCGEMTEGERPDGCEDFLCPAGELR